MNSYHAWFTHAGGSSFAARQNSVSNPDHAIGVLFSVKSECVMTDNLKPAIIHRLPDRPLNADFIGRRRVFLLVDYLNLFSNKTRRDNDWRGVL